MAENAGSLGDADRPLTIDVKITGLTICTCSYKTIGYSLEFLASWRGGRGGRGAGGTGQLHSREPNP